MVDTSGVFGLLVLFFGTPVAIFMAFSVWATFVWIRAFIQRDSGRGKEWRGYKTDFLSNYKSVLKISISLTLFAVVIAFIVNVFIH